MKIKKQCTLLLLAFTATLLSGCANLQKTKVEEAIIHDLDKLKNLDLTTAKHYITSEKLFPDVQEATTNPELVEEFISLFFQDFNYKILDIEVKEDRALATVRLHTLDAQALSRDFASAHLREEILAAANSQDTAPLVETTLDEHYILLNDLIKNNHYKTVENNCTVNLTRAEDDWTIFHTKEMENDLVGGFISNTANPNLLSPTETLDIYLSSLEEMDSNQMINYMGLAQLLQADDPKADALMNALVQQVQASFDYKIKEETQDGFTASVSTEITTFSYSAIMKEYEKNLAAYLETPQALYDGEEGRESKSNQLLLDSLTANTATSETTVSVTMINDSVSWKLQPDEAFINAIFGNFLTVSTPESSDSEESTSDSVNWTADSSAEWEYDSDDELNYDSDRE